MDAARKDAPPPITVPWLIGVARHKLADHYRRRHDRFSVPVAELPEPVEPGRRVGRRARPHRRRERAGQTARTAPHGAGAALHGRLLGARVRGVDRPHRARHRGAAGAGPPRLQIALPGAGRREVMNDNSHDPLTVLHGDELPVQPDPAFAARLRARLESALSLPNRTRRSCHEWHRYRHRRTERARREPVAPRPRGPPRCPTSRSPNARDAIAWYVDALGATLVGEPYRDGRRPHRTRRAGDRRTACSTSPTSTPSSD